MHINKKINFCLAPHFNNSGIEYNSGRNVGSKYKIKAYLIIIDVSRICDLSTSSIDI